MAIPMTVMMVRTSPSTPTWIGTRNTSAGTTTAPVKASSGWKLIAAQAVGGRLAWWGVNGVLVSGLAAGLEQRLTAGSMGSPDTVVDHDERWKCDATLRHILGGDLNGVRGGALLHSDDVVLEAGNKAALHARFNCAALDMESGFLARAAQESGLPFAVLRVICYPAERTLPPVAATVLSTDGGLNIGALLGSLLRDPRQITALIRLGQDATQARRNMISFLENRTRSPAFQRLTA